MTWAYILGAIGALILLFMAVAAFVSYRLAFYSDRTKEPSSFKYLEGEEEWKKETRESAERLRAIEYEDLYITSRDGLRLHGYFKRGKEGAPLAVMCHGYRSSPFIDFSGGGLIALEKQFNVLLIDQRAHGMSEGKAITFGIRERYDVLDWVLFMKETYGFEKIILYGVSMGAATVVMAGGLALPPEVVGIFADCPFSAPYEIISKVTRDMKLPAWLFYLPTLIGARLFAGFKLCEASAEEAIKRCTLPVLLVHGDSDGYVPHYMSERIFAAREENTTFLTFAGADHAMSYITDKERYKKAILEFENKILER